MKKIFLFLLIGSLKVKMIQEIWSYRDLLKLLVSKDIKLKYRRSVLGYLWSILNPLLIMIVMAVVFSAMFKRNIENFPVYLFCGQLLFNFMNTSTHQAIYSITANAALLKKTYVPRYIFTVAKITSGMVDLVFSLGALIIVMVATGAHFSWTCLLFPFVILQLYVFCVGLGLFLAQANVFFRDIQYLWTIFVQLLMYMSAIFYSVDAYSETVQKVFLINLRLIGRTESYDLSIESLRYASFDSFEGATADKEDILGVDMDKLLLRVFATALWWHINHRTL